MSTKGFNAVLRCEKCGSAGRAEYTDHLTTAKLNFTCNTCGYLFCAEGDWQDAQMLYGENGGVLHFGYRSMHQPEDVRETLEAIEGDARDAEIRAMHNFVASNDYELVWAYFSHAAPQGKGYRVEVLHGNPPGHERLFHQECQKSIPFPLIWDKGVGTNGGEFIGAYV